MPKFKQRDAAVITAPLPKPDLDDADKDNTGAKELKIDPAEDIKLSLAFANSKLAIPWIVLYDAKAKKSIEKLSVIFSHDDFDVLAVQFKIAYSKEIQRLDPSHPSLHSFEIVYEWSAVEEEDVATGVLVMFTSALLALGVLTYIIVTNNDGRLAAGGYKKKDDASAQTKKQRPDLSGNAGFSSGRSR